LFPCLGSNAGIDTNHGDALIDRADERAKIASHAFGFVYARNTFDRRHVGSVRRAGGCALLAGYGSHSNRRAAAGFVFHWSWMQFNVSVHRPAHAIEMNALMCAI